MSRENINKNYSNIAKDKSQSIQRNSTTKGLKVLKQAIVFKEVNLPKIQSKTVKKKLKENVKALKLLKKKYKINRSNYSLKHN